MSIIITGGLFYFIVKDYPISSFIEVFQEIEVLYVGLGLVTMSVMFLLGGIRWKVLFPQYTLWDSVNGVILGVAANFLIPMRGGELVRAFFLSKKTGVQVSKLFGKIIIERSTDMISLLIFLFISGAVLGEIVTNESGYILAMGIIACSMIYLFLTIYKYHYLSIENLITGIKFKNRILNFIKEKLLTALIPFKEVSFNKIVKAQAISFAISLSSILLLYYFLLASNVQISFLWVIVIFPLVVLSISLPVTIGHIGVYHAALLLALSFIGIDEPDMVGKVILVHLFTVIPPLLYGCFIVLLNRKIENNFDELNE
nr:lysylphosphatidylglycerol synthase transmembrane domain-containing protein [uncultured Desulfobacter sp.]